MIIKFCLFIVFIFTSSCASHIGKLDWQVKKNISYSLKPNQTRLVGDFYTPVNLMTNIKYPLVIVVHGGGWSLRDKDDMNSLAKSLASHGFAVFNINYFLAPEYKHPAPIENLGEALEHILKNKDLYNIDENKIALWGFSSGGHTSSLYALAIDQVNNKNIKAVVSGGAPYDLTWYPYSPYIKDYLGDFRDQMKKEYLDASPVNHITKSSPPFFLYHSTNDRLVEWAQQSKFEFLLKEKNVRVESYNIPFWGHMFGFVFSDEAVERGITFLKSELNK